MPGPARLELRPGQTRGLANVRLHEPVEEHGFEPCALAYRLGGLASALQGAGAQRVQRSFRPDSKSDGSGLLLAVLRERRVEPALHASRAVGLGLAMTHEQQSQGACRRS